MNTDVIVSCMKNKDRVSNMRFKTGIGVVTAPIFAYFLSMDPSGMPLYASGLALSAGYGLVNGYQSLHLTRSCKKSYGILWHQKKEDLRKLLGMSLKQDKTVTGYIQPVYETTSQDTQVYQKRKR